MRNITPCLWFDKEGEEAARFYVSLIPNSRIIDIWRNGKSGPGPESSALVVLFELDGRRTMALNGGPMFKLSEAFSMVINCDDQAEIDRYWGALSAGGTKQECGWVKDRFGVSWQIVPAILPELMADPAAAPRVMAALLTMGKLDIAGLEAAARG